MNKQFLFSVLIMSLFLIGDSKAQSQSQSEINSGFEWLSLDEAQQKARVTGKNILLFGYAEWCTYCMKMRKESFPDSSVQKSIADYYYPVQLNGESEERVTWNGKEMPSKELARYLRLGSFPTHYFIDSKGEILGAQPGYIEPYVYSPLLNYVGSGAYGEMSFEEFFEIEDESKKQK